MAAVEWSFVEDGSLSVGEQTVDLAYHPKLNTVLAVTEEPALRVLDVNSGITLQKSTLSAQSGSNIKCNYISEVDQVFLTDGRVVGLRKDLSGVLLLESALQTAVTKADDHVVVELPHSEASQLLACMMKPQRPGQEFWEEVQNELQAGLQNCKLNSADHTYHKINKWATVVLRLPHCALRSVCKTLLTELRRSNQHVPGLSIAAGIMDRLQALYPEPNQSLGNQAVDRAQMYSEAARRETFSTWPHMNYKWALPEPMAQAGFYHQPTSAGDDRAMCFTCSVCLVCWEPTDEPWSEHERHSPNCPFVRGEPTENVPLSTTLASGPAQYHGAEGNQQIACISTSSCSHLMSTSSRHGNISIWNVAHQLKLVTNFTVDPKDPAITGKAATEETSEGKPKVIEAWTEETSQSEIKSVPPSGENAKTEVGSKPIDDKEDIQPDLEKDPITKSSDREENYGSIEVICTGGAWRFPEDGPSTELKTGEDIPPIKPLVSEPPLPIEETTASTATTTTPCKDLIVSALCIVAGMESKTAPPVQSSVNPNTSQPNSPSKHIADIDNVAPPCLVAGVSLCSPKEIPPNPSDCGTQKSVVVEELTSSGGDDAGLGVDVSSRKLIYADAYLGDTVDSTSNSPVEDIEPAVRQRHCLLVYRTSPKVKESASSKTVAKAKGNLYKTSAMYSLPTLAMSEILEMEEEQQALVEEPIGLEELSTEQVSSGLLVADAGTTGSSSKSSITNEKAVQCIDLPAAVQRDDLWISGIVPCLDRQHILVVVGPHDGHLQNSGTSSNVTNKCNTVQCESRNNISQQNDLNKGSAFEDDEYDEDKPQDSAPINTSFSKPFAKFFSENMPNEEASGGPTVEDIAIGESECIKPFAKFFSENPALAQSSSNTSSSDFVPQDPGDDSGSTTNPFAKLFAGNSEDLTSSGKTDSRFFPRKPQKETDNGNKSDQPFAKYLSGLVGGGGNGGSDKDGQQNAGYVLVYKLHCKDSMVAILEEPVYIHSMGDTCKSFTKVVPLPTEICDSGSDEESDVKPDVIAQQPEELSWEPFDEADSKETPSEPALGKFAALTDEGKVIVFDAATFNILSTMVPSSLQSPKMVDRTSSNDKFIAMMYCAGMERLCVCSSSGHITFLQLATREMTRAGKRSKRIDKIDTEQETDSREDTDAPEDETGDDYLTNTPLTQENLATMRLLTQFETLVPRFSATVPPCWAEIQQEQQQRRHPQHLHQRQQGDATQHTRTWKLQPNGSKDHLFELVLPKACCVGHVDIKFTLHPSCPSPPKIQLTLLRQSGSQCLKIERETDAMNIKSAPVDAQINFNMDSPAAEPKEQNVDVTSSEEKGATAAGASTAAAAAASATGPHFRKDFNFAEDSLMKSVFLRQHREDIVCGPCDLECFVDMPSHTGVVTLTSRELMLSKNRSFLLHICAQELPGGEAGAGGKGTDGDKGTPFLPVLQSTPSSSATERLTAGSMRKETERYQGCDWVQELSITIRRTKKVNVPRDRLQRVMILESKVFHNNLVETVTGAVDGDSRIPTDTYTKELGLEILCWIAGVQICEPLRSSNTVTLVETVQKHLQALVKTCYLDSDRSIAHKCSRLLALCIGCTMRWRNPGGYDSFRLSLLQSLLHWLPVLPCATSAGALKWFFTLLNMVKQVNPESTSQACVSLLTLVAKNLEDRTLPVHSMLRARFGLYGTPLDPVLFDIEPTIPVAKSGSSKPAGISTSPYHQGVMAAPAPPGVTIGSGAFGGDIDINGNQIASSKLSRDGSATSLGGAHFMRGLLEVEPLHFMCCSTSDGTYVERIGAGHENIASAIAMSAGPGNASEGYTGGSSAALASLSSAMASAEQQLQMLQHKTHALIKLHQQKHKLEQKLQETSNSNSLPSQGYTEVFPATPKNTPFFMTPPLTPPNESTIQFGQSALWDVPDMYFPGMAPYMTKYSSKGSKAAPGTPKGKGKVTDVGRSSSEAIQTNPTLVRNLLNPPQSHVLVIDRMHSGARRFAVLDFGRPILLTDIYIPSCFDLASLSVDVWNQGEEQDGRRLAVALDIGTKDLVMNDLLPPAVCRYLKLTVVGRYGGNAVRSKIPLGVFYGHTFFSSHDQTPRDGQDSDSGFSDGQQTQQEQYLNLALAVQEDIQCRYSLACNRLEKLLSNVDIQTGPAAFMRSEKMDGTSDIHKAYQECMQLQQQLNVVQRTIGRLQQSIAPSVTQTVSTCTSVQAVRQASSDELRVFCEYLLDTMLGVTKSADPLPVNLHKALNMDTCKALFKHLCVMGTPQLRLRTGTLLVRVCSSQYWWGEFLASSLNEFFNSDQTLVFPQDRVFLLLASLGQKSLIANNSVLEHLLTLLARLLSPLLNGQVPSGFSASTGPLDLSLVGWVLLFLSRTLDHTVGTSATSATATAAGTTEGEEPEENGASGGAAAAAGSSSKSNSNATTDKDKGGTICSSRWDFMTSNGQTLAGQHTTGGIVNRGHLQSRIQSKLKKQLQLHKEQLTQLQSMHKAIQAKAVEEGKDNDPMVQVQIKKKLQQHASKHLRDILRIRRITERNLRARGFLSQPTVSQDKPADSPLPEVQLPRQNCIPVLQGLMNLLLAMDFTCHVDLFLVTCKVLARIANATRPAITLSEIASSDQLTRLLLLCVSSEHNQGMSSWGGPWASHAITCLLQDILEGERLYPFSDDFHITDSSISVTEDTSDLDSDLTPDAMPDEVEAAGGANGSDESESNGGDIFSEGAGPTEQTYMSPVPEPDVEFIGTPLDPYDAQYMDHVIFGSSKYDDFDWPEKSHPMKVACKFGATQSPFGSSHKNRAKYRGGPPPSGDTLKGGGSLLPSVSMAMDARLEQGLELQVEWYLKVTSLMDAHSVGQTFSGPLCVPPASAHLPPQPGDLPPTDDTLAANMASGRRQVEPSTSMLSKCFNQLFGQLQYHRVQLDSLLQLWLQVLEANPEVEKQDNSFDATVVPSIPLNQSSLNKLLAALAWQLNIPVHTWCLAFHALSAVANSKEDSIGVGMDIPSMANIIVMDTNLLPALVHFLSGSALHGTAGSQHYSQVGPTVTQALYEFLSRLQIKLASSQTPNTLALKELLLRLVHILSEPSGAFHTGTGPLDAQVRFLDFVVEQAFGRTEINSIVSMIDSISLLVHNHITRTQRVAQYTNSDTNVNARSCFGGLFASMLRPGDVRSSGGEASRDVLMCSLLQLVNQLIKVPLDDDSAARFLRELPRQEIPLVGADLGSLPVTDSSKLNASMQQSIASVGSAGGPMSDDDKERSEASAQSATPTAAAAAPAEPQQVPKVCDIVLSNKETLSLLLSALNHCSSNTMASIIGSSTLYPSASDSFANVDPLSVGDNIFQILCTLGNKAHSVELMLRPLLSYLSTNQGKTGCSLSEPLLWFILKILGEQKSLQAFHDMGGVRIVCTNLVVSNRAVIDTSPSTVSAIMQHLGSMAKPANNASTSSSRTSRTVAGASAEVENVDGLVNFAPYGSINSSSATAQPAEVLLQPTPPHRRARSAAWSYHFYPDEAWCDLHITLPNAILLREVHIQPHLTSLATCPSSVSLEISADGSTTIPICPPLPTSGLTYVKLQLPRPEITTSVCLRLHRPRDSNTIGLSQIMLLGVTAFGNISNGSQSGLLWSSDDNAAKSSIRWLRLLHHCLTQVPQLEVQIANTASRMPALLTTCSSLLLSPHCQIYAANIEAVMLKLGLCCTDVGLTMFDLLLRSNYSTGEEEHAPPMLGHSAGVSSHSTVDIIFQLGTSQDAGTKDRVQALLDWLGDTARVALRKHSHFHRAPHTLSPAEAGLLNPAPAHVHCVATIIWASHQQANSYSVASLLTNELFSSVYEWSMVLPLNSTLKRAADFVLCAMCYVQPALFESLLQWMGISLESGLDLETSLTDDNKDAQEHAVRHTEDNTAGLTDDTKGAAAIHQQTSPVIDGYVQFPMEEFAHVMLDEAHLSTLAVVCQSETSTDRILGSGFPAILAQALAEFCSQEIIRNQSSGQLASPGLTDASKIKARSPRSPRGVGPRRSSSESNISDPVVSLTADLIAPVLDFFTELCSQLRMKNWLGSAEGSVFWTPLLTLLCNISANHVQSPLLASPRKQQVLTSSQRSAVESATITFYSKCITCHQTNQKLLAQVICDVTCSRGSQAGIRFAISGFTRRLILQLMLEDEKLTVFLKATFRLYKSQQGVASQLEHPQFGTGHNYKVVEAKLASTCGQLVAQVSDTSSSSLMSDKPKTGKEESGKSSSHASGASVSSKSTFSIYSKEPNLLSKMKPKKVAVFDKETNNTSPQLPPHPQKHTAPATSKLFVSMQSIDNKEGSLQVPRVHLMHELLSAKGLPDNVTLAQLVGVLQQKGMPSGFPMVQFGLNIRKEELDASKTDSSKSAEAEEAASASATKSPDTKSAEDAATLKSLLDAPPIPSFLHIFASLGGLALIAEHLPVVYHDVPRQSGAEESRRDRQSDKWADNVNMAWQLSQAASETWAPMEPVVEEMEVYEPPSGGSSMVPSASAASSSPVSSAAAIPPHSLGAFGLFLRLPGYAEVLLKEHKKAQFLLRLVLGVTDDGDGGHILTSPQASSLPTLPFTVLVTLFDSTPLTTDDGVLLRRMTLEIGAIHLILACLAVLSHHGPRVSNGTTSSIPEQLPGPPTQPTGMTQAPTTGGEKGSQSYWAKGTGFGTGSTSSGWNVEQALIRQKAEEEHVTCLLKVLSSYINPSGTAWDNVLATGCAAAAAASASIDREPDDNMDQLQNIFPAVFVELLSQSCLIPAISSYLRNDSVLDMARHVPLYCALLEILRALACCPMLASLLLPQNGDDQISGSETSVISLLENMKSCVDTYTSRLKLNKEGKPNSRRALGKDTTPEEDADAEGLTQLVPEIQRTVEIVTRATSKLIAASRDEMDREDSDGSASLRSSTKVSMEEHYVKIMKKMQFDTYRMITEEDDGKINFVLNHHYASNVKSSGNVTNASRARRLAQEAVTLSNSLPLSASSSVFVRCDEDRLDVMKVLITGPGETPYANGCFEFDVYFPADYPVSPMLVNLETTGQHSVRFNPNLYNDGKVCLSVLNTWHGRPEEKWNAQTSSFLQVLVSIQSLILVSEPYFNEPGYERSRGTPSGTQSSREYDANIMQATVKWAMLEMLRNPPACFKEVIQTHFYMKRTEVMAQCEEWISQLAQLCNDKRVGRSVAHHWAALKRHTAQLREELTKLKPTKILQEESNKTLQEKSTAPAEAAATAAAAAASTPTNQGSSPPVADNGTSQDKPSTDPQPAASGTDPLGVGAVESLHNGGDDEAGLY